MPLSCICCLMILMMTSTHGQPTDLQAWQNVALNKQCNMSSSYTGDGYNNNCSTAINGNTSMIYRPGNCIHTATGDGAPSWTVNLGQTYTVQRITIFARDEYDTRDRLTNVEVWVEPKKVYTFPSSVNNIAVQTDLVAGPSDTGLPARGQVVNLIRTSAASDSTGLYLNVCEVQVWVCRPGYYGGNCAKCINECTGKPCDDIDNPNDCPEANACLLNPCRNGGMCQRRDVTAYNCICVAGYRGTNCESECDNQHYGVNCNKTCGAGCNGGTCDSVSGRCIISKCLSGFQQTPECDQEVPASESENTAGPIIGSVLGAAVILGGCVLAGFCWKRRAAGGNARDVVDRQVDDGNVSHSRPLHMSPVTNSARGTETETHDISPNPELPMPVMESEINVYEVIRENLYDALHPYSNGISPESDAYTRLHEAKHNIKNT